MPHIPPISILDEFRTRHGNKLVEELSELFIQEDPELGAYLSYALEEEDLSTYRNIFRFMFSTPHNTQQELKDWFFGLGDMDHHFYADMIFKEDDHFEENHDFIKTYPFKEDVHQLIVEDFTADAPDPEKKKRISDYIDECFNSGFLSLADFSGEGWDLYADDRNLFMEGLKNT